MDDITPTRVFNSLCLPDLIRRHAHVLDFPCCDQLLDPSLNLPDYPNGGRGAVSAGFNLQEADVHDRMTYHRAIDAAVWAMPLMNFKFYRDALADAGVGPNDVGYFSKLQDWRFQTATPNNTTPYILTYWNFKDGPIVVEMPVGPENPIRE